MVDSAPWLRFGPRGELADAVHVSRRVPVGRRGPVSTAAALRVASGDRVLRTPVGTPWLERDERSPHSAQVRRLCSIARSHHAKCRSIATPNHTALRSLPPGVPTRTRSGPTRPHGLVGVRDVPRCPSPPEPGTVMLPYEWQALRIGDRVLVHDDRTPGLDTHHGVVAIVQTRRHDTNEVAIRIDGTGELIRPRRHAVHQLPLDRRIWCWRCDTTATRAQLGDSGLAA